MLSNTAILSTVEIETLLSDIRGRLLLHARNETVPEMEDDIFSWTQRLFALVELTYGVTKKDLVQTLAETIFLLTECPKNESGGLIRTALDALTSIEAEIVTIGGNDEPFELDVADFVNASFDDLMPHQPESAVWEPEEVVELEGFEIDAELLEIFSGEADELLKSIEECLDKLITNPADKDSLWEIRRNAHTFKGASGIVGLMSASKIAHRIEDLLDRFAEKEADSGLPILELLRTSTNYLRAMTTVDGEQPGSENLQHLYRSFDAALSHIGEAQEQPAEVTTPVAVPAKAVPIAADKGITSDDRKRSIIRVPLEKLDDLEVALHDLVVAGSAIERRLADLEQQISELHNTSSRLQSTSGKIESSFEADMLGRERVLDISIPTKNADEQFDALEFDRYTEFHQNTRALAEAASDNFAINTSLDAIHSGLESLFDRQKRNLKAIQDALLRIRMVEFGTIRTRLQRTARVTAEEQGREVELLLTNETSKLDTQMLDLLSEPLMHLIRNAVVHGIEPPEIRRLLGKPETGKITVAFGNETTHIVLTISDDGSGIAASRLKEKAVNSGLLTKENADALSDQEAMKLIFEPGLTTAEKLSMSAGRGVGMSIVKAGIEAAGGSVDIDSRPQSGTRIIVRLPLKMAMLNAIVIRANDQFLAIPSNQVLEITYKSACSVKVIDEIPFLITDAGPYRIHDTFEALYGKPNKAITDDKTVVIVETVSGRVALTVDEVLRTEELALKTLGRPLDRLKCILGVAITGNDEVLPILNVSELVELPRTTDDSDKTNLTSMEIQIPTILIVDDSPSVRHMTSKIVENAGWRSVTARDGMEALDLLTNSSDPPIMILTDIEMPRMDGFELIRSLNADDNLCTIPVVVITSRSGEKHRGIAEELGIDKFLSKPFNENELIAAIRSFSEVV
jgi:chemosensory pili system protein ChpA (sensor histidine kinase/response regulator)